MKSNHVLEMLFKIVDDLRSVSVQGDDALILRQEAASMILHLIRLTCPSNDLEVYQRYGARLDHPLLKDFAESLSNFKFTLDDYFPIDGRKIVIPLYENQSPPDIDMVMGFEIEYVEELKNEKI